jgi:hypothetical protein
MTAHEKAGYRSQAPGGIYAGTGHVLLVSVQPFKKAVVSRRISSGYRVYNDREEACRVVPVQAD